MFLFSARIRWALRGLPDLTLAVAFYQISLHTMTRPVRAKALWRICRQVLQTNVAGDFVECGVWRGGSAGLMGLAMRKFSKSPARKLHLYDSFEGLPAPSKHDGEIAERYWQTTTTPLHDSSERCVAGIATVRTLLFDSLRLQPETVVIHQGWFQETLADLSEGPSKIAVLRLDGDWYESTKVCLEALYARVSPGGAVILDDYYCWEGCRAATDEFRLKAGIQTPMHRIDSEACYWIKESP